jgi:hypothetical protein
LESPGIFVHAIEIKKKVAQVCNLRGLDRVAPFVVNKGFFSDDRPQVTNLRYLSFS